MSSSNIFGYIYLLQLRESYEKNEDIYKIGRTNKKQFERFNQYPNGSVLYLQIKCLDCVNIERHLINLFTKTFLKCDRCKIYGAEYFNGNPFLMMQLILKELDFSCNLDKHNIIQQQIKQFEIDHKTLSEDMSVLKTKCSKLSNDLQLANKTIYEQQDAFLQQSNEMNKKIFDLQSEITSLNGFDQSVTTEKCDDLLPYVCKKCKKSLSSKQTLKNHESICKGVHSLQCPKCKREFRTAPAKHQHIKNVICVKI